VGGKGEKERKERKKSPRSASGCGKRGGRFFSGNKERPLFFEKKKKGRVEPHLIFGLKEGFLFAAL